MPQIHPSRAASDDIKLLLEETCRMKIEDETVETGLKKQSLVQIVCTSTRDGLHGAYSSTG